MDYFKDIENKLKEFSMIDEKLLLLNERLNKAQMRGCPKDITAIDFSKIGHGSGGNEAMHDLVEVQHILKQIKKVEDEKEIINNILNIFKTNYQEEYNFIRVRYLENNTMDETATKLGYSINSKQSLYALKDRSVNRFLGYYWGE